MLLFLLFLFLFLLGRNELFQLGAWSENWNCACWQVHLLSVTGVNNCTGRTIGNIKCTETANQHALALAELLGKFCKDSVGDDTNLLLGKTSCFCNGCNQFFFVHYELLVFLNFAPSVLAVPPC